MKKTFALISILLLVFSGIRAPDVRTLSRGICWSGTAIEKAADTSSSSQTWTKQASNPLLLHSGFAPAAHPFDFPEAPALSNAAISGFLASHAAVPLNGNSLFPHDRPPIAFSF